MMYDELVKEIEDSPRTWKPALLIKIIAACIREKVFKDRAAIMRVIVKTVDAASLTPEQTITGVTEELKSMLSSLTDAEVVGVMREARDVDEDVVKMCAEELKKRKPKKS